MPSKKIIEDVIQDSPCKNGGWCFLRELIAHTGLSDRQIEQIRLVYDYKFIKSEEERKDIGNERAWKEFIEQYAGRFAEIYKDGMTHDELFSKVFRLEPFHIK